MIEDLLDASKIEAGTFRITPGQNNLALIVSEMVESMMSAAEEKRISLIHRIADENLQAYCDRERIIQVLNNLIGNAIKFSPAGSTVTLEADRRDSWVAVSVVDEGHGISPDELAHLFERHWQARATAHLGTGLGLFICNRIVESHGGRITVESHIGEGTRFTFTLPMVRDPRRMA